MKRCSTIILRCAVFLAGALILTLCGLTTILSVKELFSVTADYDYLTYILLIGTYASAAPFFIALYQALKLLNYIDSDRVFTELSVKALRIITHCAMAVFVVCTLGGLPFFYAIAQLDDAPGAIIIGMAISGVAFIVAVFASVLNRLLQDVIEIKTENDLTI